MLKRLIIIPAGKTKVIFNGRLEEAGAVRFHVQHYAAQPLDFYGFYKYYLRETVTKALGHIYFADFHVDERQHRPRINQVEYIEALKSASRDFKEEF